MKKKSKKTYYKVLDKNGCAPFAWRSPQWSLPRQHTPGMWHTVIGRLEVCVNGLHLVKSPHQIENWLGDRLQGRRLFTCEVSGTVVVHGRHPRSRKYVARTARLLKEVVRGTPEWGKALRGTRAVLWQPLPS